MPKPTERNPNCRQGCETQDHLSYFECLRAANIHIGPLK